MLCEPRSLIRIVAYTLAICSLDAGLLEAQTYRIMHSTETTTPHAHHDTRPSEAHFATTFDRFEGDGYMTQVGFWPKIGSHMETKQKPSPRLLSCPYPCTSEMKMPILCLHMQGEHTSRPRVTSFFRLSFLHSVIVHTIEGFSTSPPSVHTGSIALGRGDLKLF